ncbi:hypothetical protein N752_07255 [Desulforamulus aquiferis]|nr:sugar phosphate nucleotidyltransferase [Desulforamulus aquiferis]RYD05686.1 hypothetical protein N752_07255 [Desulforamulus aquiferis]
MEAIVLVGGLGTRLKTIVSEVPKPMAAIGGYPFLTYLLEYLSKYNIKKVILATGYMHEKIMDYYGYRYGGIVIDYSIEYEPLGTGGAIKKALENVSEKDVFILNGDSFFDINLNHIYSKHLAIDADLTLSLNP